MRTILIGFLAIAICSCGPMMKTTVKPGKRVDCPDGKFVITIDCTTDLGLKQQVISANASIPQLGIGIGGKYEEKAVGQITDGTYQLALRLESICKDYNACMLTTEQYNLEARSIRTRLNQHVAMAGKLAKDKSVGDALWTNAVPELAKKRIQLQYGVRAYNKGSADLGLHASGSTLNSGDGIQFVTQVTQSTYVYILLMASQGEASVLFPQSEINQKNPLPAGKEIYLPANGVFELDNVTGTESIQILASAEPLADLETRLAELKKGGGNKQLLETIGEKLCDEKTGRRGLKLKKSSVSCGDTVKRGLVYKKGTAGKTSSTLVARPNDNVIIFQHIIDHK
ncbi:MAG: DUF4384 domain-containing protein [Deltaproteobacteria bacterium]|nr:DUF4384 domain-containing protein [Deltaproteobacteria bacterium]